MNDLQSSVCDGCNTITQPKIFEKTILTIPLNSDNIIHGTDKGRETKDNPHSLSELSKNF
jgi:hypothetical protein